MAVKGADDGTLLWVGRDDRLDCAVILHPDDPLERAVLVTYVAMLGLGDALSVVVPPMTDVIYTWPNRIEANGGGVAAIEIYLPNGVTSGSVPDWMALFAAANVTAPLPLGSDAKRRVTSLREEGCEGLTPAELLETFARHFLNWVNRWQDDGFEPVRATWLHRAPARGEAIEIDVEGERVAGKFSGIADDGALVLDTDGAVRRVDLCDALFGVAR